MVMWYMLVQWFNPKPYKWRRPFGGLLELYRCDTDRRLLTIGMIRTGLCAGHHVRQPAYPTVFELLLIWIGMIR